MLIGPRCLLPDSHWRTMEVIRQLCEESEDGRVTLNAFIAPHDPSTGSQWAAKRATTFTNTPDAERA